MQLQNALLAEERSVYDSERGELSQILADEKRDKESLKSQLTKERTAHEEEKRRAEGASRQSSACVHAAIEIDDVEATETSEVLEELLDAWDEGDWKVTRED